MIRENLVAERIAIDSYRDAIKYLGSDDPTTRRMLEGILAVEEEHADELSDLLQGVPSEPHAATPNQREKPRPDSATLKMPRKDVDRSRNK